MSLAGPVDDPTRSRSVPAPSETDLAGKPVDASRSVMTEIVLPNDTNQLGNLFGGRLLQFMDICGALASQRHAERVCVTKSVDSVEFRSPIYLGEIVNLEATVNRAFRTSMEIEVNVWAEDARNQNQRRWSNRAYYTFVAVDDDFNPVRVPPVLPETDEERARYDAAARRRELRLVVSGRIHLRDADHLRDDFLEALK